MIELFNIDCMEYMKTCTDNQFDLAIVDPPYKLGINGFVSTARINKGGNLFQKNRKFTPVDGQYLNANLLNGKPPPEYWNELFRISKNQIIFGLQYFIDNLTSTHTIIVWDKMNGESKFSDCELAWTSFEGASRIIKCFNEPCGTNQLGRIHPTQKPIKLYKKILHKYATKGMSIIDTHLGSGNIAIAAHYAEMNLTGLEINEDYYNAAKKNFNDNTQQTFLTF